MVINISENLVTQPLPFLVPSFFTDTRSGLLELLSRYKFVLAFENGRCDDYVTEKIWDALAAGAVPVYAGADNVDKIMPNKKSAILVDEFASAKELARHLEQVLLYRDHTERATMNGS